MSWLNDYLEYTEGQESPEKFHFWCGIAVIAGVLGRNVFLERRSRGVTRYTVFPGQLQINLIGASGRVRKNGAMMQAKPFLDYAGVNLIGGKSSVEAFLDQLDPAKKGRPQSMLYETELTVLLNNSSYAAPMIDVLTKLADAEDPFKFYTRGGGKIIIPKPCLTIFAATTPSNLGKGMPPQAHETGYIARGLYVYERDTDRIEPLTDLDDTDITSTQLTHIRQLEQQLKNGIDGMKSLIGPFTYTQGGRDWFNKHYIEWTNSPNGKGEGYPSKRPDHLLRVAMVLQVAKCTSYSPDELVLDEKSLAAADLALRSIEVDFPKAFSYVGTLGVKDRERIIEALVINGGQATSSQIYNRVHRFFYDLDAIRRTMALLEQAGLIEKIQAHDNTTGRKETWKLIKEA